LVHSLSCCEKANTKMEMGGRILMKRSRSLIGLIVTGVLVVSVLALVPGVVPGSALAQTGTAPGTITVVGEGIVKVKPDVAQATVGVELSRPTVAEASAEVSDTMDDVMAALREQGIAEKDMQTTGFSVWSDQAYNPDGTRGEMAYRVSNQVNVTIRDLDSVGAVLDAAMEAGANSIYGVTFSLEDKKSAQSDARAEAVADATDKAEELAELTGLMLGNVVSVSEVIGGGGYYGGVYETAAGMGGGGPIAPGELEVSVQLQVVYATVQ
jgi:uncharacterized protein